MQTKAENLFFGSFANGKFGSVVIAHSRPDLVIVIIFYKMIFRHLSVHGCLTKNFLQKKCAYFGINLFVNTPACIYPFLFHVEVTVASSTFRTFPNL